MQYKRFVEIKALRPKAENPVAKTETCEEWPPRRDKRDNVMKVDNSSWISEILYDDKRKILKIITSTGKTYSYLKVNKLTHERFLNSPSRGRFFSLHIRGRFECKQQQ